MSRELQSSLRERGARAAMVGLGGSQKRVSILASNMLEQKLSFRLGQECKRQKMKCEAMPGEQRCRNCQRRNLECVMKYAANNPSMAEVENRYE